MLRGGAGSQSGVSPPLRGKGGAPLPLPLPLPSPSPSPLPWPYFGKCTLKTVPPSGVVRGVLWLRMQGRA